MEHIVSILAVLLVSYLLGSIPFGWIIVKLATGRDIRGIELGARVEQMPGERLACWPGCLPRC